LEKDAAVKYWCDQVTISTKTDWNYIRVNQDFWNKHSFDSLAALLKAISVGDNLIETKSKL